MKSEPDNFTLWHGLFLAESLAVLIALATTIVPTKTGSKHGIAGYFFEQPTFLQEFLVNLVGIHIVLILVAIVVVVWARRSGSAGPSPTEE